jgi:hypothetical protein
MKQDLAVTRLAKAVELLAVGTESIQERLSAAWLELMPLSRSDFPVELQEHFSVVESEMLDAPDEPLEVSDELAAASAERVFRLALMVWSASADRKK